jgi:hypothetical protein
MGNMCRFMVIGLRESDVEHALRALPEGICMEPCKIAGVLEQMPPGFSAWTVTDGICSCSLLLEEHFKADQDREEAKYRKKGWSETKIRRALSDSEHTAASRLRTSRRKALYQWLNELAEQTYSFVIGYGWVGGDVAEGFDEPFENHRVTARSLLLDGGFRENVWYRVRTDRMGPVAG